MHMHMHMPNAVSLVWGLPQDVHITKILDVLMGEGGPGGGRGEGRGWGLSVERKAEKCSQLCVYKCRQH